MNELAKCLGLAALIVAGHGAPALAVETVASERCSPTDASLCIQSAIANAAAAKSDVVIAPGVYTLLHPIQLVSGVSIFGSSESILQPSLGNRDGSLLVYGARVRDIRIEGITFDGGGKDFPSDSSLITLDGTQNIVLDGVSLQHARGTALVILSNNGMLSAGNGLQNSHVFDVGNHWRTTLLTSGRKMGVVFWDGPPLQSRSNFARHNRFEDIGLDAIQVAGQQGFIGEANFFELDNGQRDLLEAPDYPAAFFAESDTDLTIRNNTIRGALGNCIDLPGVTGATIEGNLITACGQSGVGVFQDYDFDKISSSNVVIRGNVILNSAIWNESSWRAGISIGGGKPHDITIAGNIITDMRPKGQKTQDYGIDVVNTTVKKLKIEDDNRLDGNQRARTHGIN